MTSAKIQINIYLMQFCISLFGELTMKNSKKKIDLVFTIILFIAFAFLSVVLVTSGLEVYRHAEYVIGLITPGRYDTKSVVGKITGVERRYERPRNSSRIQEISEYHYMFTVDGETYAKSAKMSQYGDNIEEVLAQQKPFYENDTIETIFEATAPERGVPLIYAQNLRNTSAHGSIWILDVFVVLIPILLALDIVRQLYRLRFPKKISLETIEISEQARQKQTNISGNDRGNTNTAYTPWAVDKEIGNFTEEEVLAMLPPEAPKSHGLFSEGFYFTGNGVGYRRNLYKEVLSPQDGTSGCLLFLLKAICGPLAIFAFFTKSWLAFLIFLLLGFADMIAVMVMLLLEVTVKFVKNTEIDLNNGVVKGGFTSVPIVDIDSIYIEEHTQADRGYNGCGGRILVRYLQVGIYVDLCSTHRLKSFRIAMFRTWELSKAEIVKNVLFRLLGKNLKVQYTVDGELQGVQ